MKECKGKFDLVVTIVDKGFAEEAVQASKKAGAEGGTILGGRGSGIHEQATLFGMSIEPEKEVLLTLIPRDKTEAVLAAINEAAGLDTPGKGIAFVLQVDKMLGVCHLTEQECSCDVNNKEGKNDEHHGI